MIDQDRYTPLFFNLKIVLKASDIGEKRRKSQDECELFNSERQRERN